VTFQEREGKTMKVLQKILFTFAMVVGLSLAVSAQKDDQKKHPPKQPPPVINPGENKKPPKNEGKPKKSSAEFIIAAKESLVSLA